MSKVLNIISGARKAFVNIDKGAFDVIRKIQYGHFTKPQGITASKVTNDKLKDFRLIESTTKSLLYSYDNNLSQMYADISAAKFDINRTSLISHSSYKNLVQFFNDKFFTSDTKAIRNTIAEVYPKAYAILTDKKYQAFMLKLHNLSNTLTLKYNLTQEELATKIFASTMINSYLQLYAYMVYSTIYINAMMVKNDVEIKDFIYKFSMDYLRFDMFATRPTCINIDFFEINTVQKLEKSLSDITAKVKSKESLEIDISHNDELSHVRSDESLVLIAFLIVGAIAFVPFLRVALYYFQALKVDISKICKSNAMMLGVNIEILTAKLELMKSNKKDNIKEIERLQKVIEKQRKQAGTLIAIADKVYQEEKEVETKMDSSYEQDEQQSDSDMESTVGNEILL